MRGSVRVPSTRRQVCRERRTFTNSRPANRELRALLWAAGIHDALTAAKSIASVGIYTVALKGEKQSALTTGIIGY